jgi:hypothetical protein
LDDATISVRFGSSFPATTRYLSVFNDRSLFNDVGAALREYTDVLGDSYSLRLPDRTTDNEDERLG